VDGAGEQFFLAAARTLEHDRRLAAGKPGELVEPVRQGGLHRRQSLGSIEPTAVEPQRSIHQASHRYAKHEERPAHLDQVAIAEHHLLVAPAVHLGPVLGAIDQLPGRRMSLENGVLRRHPSVDDAETHDAPSAAHLHVDMAPSRAEQPHFIHVPEPETQGRLAQASRLRNQKQARSRAESSLAIVAGTHRESAVNAVFH
jgi:hypothetical protein